MVNLQLTEEEARVLSWLLASVAGDPINSGRRVTDQIQHKLCDLKMHHTLATEHKFPFSETANFVAFVSESKPI